METKENLLKRLKAILEDGSGLTDLIQELEGDRIQLVVYDEAGYVVESTPQISLDRAIQLGTTAVRCKPWWSFKVFGKGGTLLVDFRNMGVTE